MEHGKIVFLKADVLESAEQFFRIMEQIGENGDQGAGPDFFRKVVQRRGEICFTFGFGRDERVGDELEMRGCAPRRNFGRRTWARNEQARGITLIYYKISERSGEALGIIELGAVLKTEAH